MKQPVLDAKGKKIGEIALRPEVFDVKVSEPAVHDAVRALMCEARAGAASTKGRSEVRGGGRKPWRQKGTGRARAGSIRSPLWRGGGVVFGPKPRDYGVKLPKKVRALALRSVLTSKVKDGKFLVLDKLAFSRPETKKAAGVVKSLKLSGRGVLVVAPGEEVIERSFRNLAQVDTVYLNEVNLYDLLNNDTLIMTKTALEAYQEALAGERS